MSEMLCCHRSAICINGVGSEMQETSILNLLAGFAQCSVRLGQKSLKPVHRAFPPVLILNDHFHLRIKNI